MNKLFNTNLQMQAAKGPVHSRLMPPLLLATVKRLFHASLNQQAWVPWIRLIISHSNLRPGASRPAPYQWAPRGSISARRRMGLIYRDCQGSSPHLHQSDGSQVASAYATLSPHQLWRQRMLKITITLQEHANHVTADPVFLQTTEILWLNIWNET